ncbi:MAG: YqcI/YcgG family protein [Verrucomicrobiota bacterium]|nr:YqcI/YcgG family protein [Verrucomicrobiota bacterium]
MSSNLSGPCAAEGKPQLQPAPHGGWMSGRFSPASAPGGFLQEAHAEFGRFVTQPEFPCVGARAAFHSESYALSVYDELASDRSTAELARDLFAFTRSEIRAASEYATFVAVFRQPQQLDELLFEHRLWQQLGKLNALDAAHFEWDPSVRSDPTDPQFSFSFAGQALYVIGLQPQSSRLARQFRWPTLIFNPHEQFERLRADGKWKRMQQTIRDRDVQLQGSINPMLSDFGQTTEARQYSGRAVEEDWRAPFEAAQPAKVGKCPFHH